jgi:hypothetical protein
MRAENGCESCGMPMRTAEDHAGSDVSKAYCRYCARPDGTRKSYDEALVGMTGFLQRTQGIDENAAREMARSTLAQQPAWRTR